MDARIFFLLVAAVMIAGFAAEIFYGGNLHDASARVASDRVILKIGEPTTEEQLP